MGTNLTMEQKLAIVKASGFGQPSPTDGERLNTIVWMIGCFSIGVIGYIVVSYFYRLYKLKRNK